MNTIVKRGLPWLRTMAVLVGLAAAGLGSAGTPGVYTQYVEPNRPGVAGFNASAPRPIGKLFTNAGTCSASVISPNNIIVTAAHCCWNRSTNAWIGGWSFSVAYHNGDWVPRFPWQGVTVLNSWIANGDTPSDICLIRLLPNSTGHTVTWYAGWLGRMWDGGTVLSQHALGYPGNIGGGNTLQLCTAESFSSAAAGCGGSSILNMGCNMTFGASGGPWINRYRSNNYVDAVVHGWQSAACTGAFGTTFNGPRFTSGNIVPLCTAAGC
jgi:V8-like Glu-specific endopeptidase